MRKQIDWQLEKFEFSGSQEGREVYTELRKQIKELQKNGWEVEFTQVLGYETSTGSAMVLLGLCKYADEEE